MSGEPERDYVLAQHVRSLEHAVASLTRRVDGLEAVTGELRAKLEAVERDLGAIDDWGEQWARGS